MYEIVCQEKKKLLGASKSLVKSVPGQEDLCISSCGGLRKTPRIEEAFEKKLLRLGWKYT